MKKNITIVENETALTKNMLLNALRPFIHRTRKDVADALRYFFRGPGVYIHIGGHHVSVNEDGKRTLMITGDGPDWK